MKTKEEVVEMFQKAQESGDVIHYRKSGVIKARSAVPGEEVITIVDDKEETRSTASDGDFVAVGAKNEKYIIKADVFPKRYRLIEGEVADDEGFVSYEAIGECHAFQYKGPDFSFMAPWEEEMIVNSGDFIAVVDPNVPPEKFDIYRIEKSIFEETYKEA